MVRRSRVLVLLIALISVVGLVSACVDSSEEDAQTPAGAETVANSALQTDSEGKTITAPGATAPAEGGGEGEEGGGEEGGAGDAAAGEEVFASACQSCHLNGGRDAGGIGPQLAGMGYDAEFVTNQIVNGGGGMPANLVQGADLENAVAYVLSLE